MKLSVVIPAYNEELFLPRLLTALKNQTIKEPFEIVVADNNSTDRTAEIAKSFGARVVHEKKQGFAYAANAAFFAATGDILVRSDADSVPPPQWLETIATKFQRDKDIIAVGGPLFPLESSTWESFFFYPTSVLWMYILKFLGRGFIFTNMAVKSEIFHELQGFRAVYGEDTDLCMRMVRKGKVKIFLPMYTYTSIRRMRSLGAKAFLFKYVFGNEIAKAKKKKVTLGLEIVRTNIPYRESLVTQNPWLYVIVGLLTSSILILFLALIPLFILL